MNSAIVLAARAGHGPGARVGMIELDVEALDEAEAEQPARDVERRLDHLVELQIGLDLALVEIEQRLAPLLGVIAPVPGRDLEIAALGGDDLLQRLSFAQRCARAGVQTDCNRPSAASGVFAIVSARRKLAKLS